MTVQAPPLAASLSALLAPRSVAVIGASADPGKISGRPIAYLQRFGYQGAIYPINPRYQQVQGLTAYPDIAAVPDGAIDLAIIAIPASGVVESVRACAERGVQAAIVFSSGFAEESPEGAERQRELAEIARVSGMRILGPNCLGVMNLHQGMIATFSTGLQNQPPVPGRIAFVTQSGAFGTGIFNVAQRAGLGFSYFVNTGNEVDVRVPEAVLHLVEDPSVGVLLAYLEGLRDGRAMLRAAERARQLDKPIVVVKVGRSETGARAAQSHTASLAGADAVYDAAFRQSGIIRVDVRRGMEGMLDVARMFVNGRRANGPRMTVVTMSGGAGVLIADVAAEEGLELPEWSGPWRERMQSLLPAFGSSLNPIDVTGQIVNDPELLARALELITQHPATDVIVVSLVIVEHAVERLVEVLKAVAASTDKPLVVVWVGGSGRALELLNEAGIPTYTDPSRAVDAVGALVRYSAMRRSRSERAQPGAGGTTRQPERAARARQLLDRVRGDGRATLMEHEAKEVLALYGVPFPAERVARSAEEAVAAATTIGFPVALKIIARDVVHKSEMGGVQLGLAEPDTVRQAYDEIVGNLRQRAPGAQLEGVLVSAMAPPGAEVVVGLKRDPVFGPVVLVGLGGILVEVLRDVSLRVVPIDAAAADQMLDELRGQAVLKGVRGQPPRDRQAVVEIIQAVSALAEELGDQVQELDLNPVIVGPAGGGALVVDAAMIVQPITHEAGSLRAAPAY